MQEVFENIIEKLEKKVETAKRIMVPEIHDELDRIANETAESFIEAYKESIEIVKQVVVEYNNGWIPCSECLPENISTVVVQVKEIEKPTFGWYGNMTGWRLTEKDFIIRVISNCSYARMNRFRTEKAEVQRNI